MDDCSLLAATVVAAFYTLAVNTGYWELAANILMVAGAFYAFVIQRFEADGNSKR